MRRIAVINQKGGVGKTTTTANLGAALAQQGRRVVVVDMDAQANLSLSLGVEIPADKPSTYSVLSGTSTLAQALRPTSIANMSLLPSNIDLSGAELELANAIGREYLMRDALRDWESEQRRESERSPADYVIFDCPPSLGLLSINALAASGEVLITLQTEFLALQGMTKLVEVVQLLRRRLNPELEITGILPCLYDSRLKLAREVLGEIRAFFPNQVFAHPVRSNVKLAEAPSYGMTIFEYAPESNGAHDYRQVARALILQEGRDPALQHLPPFKEAADRAPVDARPNSAPVSAVVSALDRTDRPAQVAAPAPRDEIQASTTSAVIESLEMRTAAESSDQAPALAEACAPQVAAIAARIVADSSAVEAADAPADASSELNDQNLRDVVLRPAGRPAEAVSSQRNRILRPEDLPALPPDAFEILTSYLHDR